MLNKMDVGGYKMKNGKKTPKQGKGTSRPIAQRTWDEDWLALATKLCSVDDGLPASVGGFTLTKSRHRAEQLKAYGNAIVPQVAVEIMRGMK